MQVSKILVSSIIMDIKVYIMAKLQNKSLLEKNNSGFRGIRIVENDKSF